MSSSMRRRIFEAGSAVIKKIDREKEPVKKEEPAPKSWSGPLSTSVYYV